jgi:hypothetical protein
VTRVIPLGDGKEIVVSHDLGKTRISIWANRGELGVEIDRKSAIRLRAALFAAVSGEG